MEQMKRPKFKTIKALSGYKLDLVFINGDEFILDKKKEVFHLPGLKPLRNEKAWLGATMSEYGWTIEWLEFDIQIGADTLWLDAQAQNAKTPEMKEFIFWRVRNGLSLFDAAKALGLTPRTVSAYGTGDRPIPHYITLACKGWEIDVQQKKAA